MPDQTPPRPRDLTKEQRVEVAAALAAELCKLPGMTDQEQIVTDLARYAMSHMDGYELAKTMDDRCYWDCDMSVAEVLDQYAGFYSDALDKAQKAWVEEHGIQPSHPIGTRVRIMKVKIGVIHGVAEGGAAKYLVHVHRGKNPYGTAVGTTFIVPFEDVEPIEDAPVPLRAEVPARFF